MFEDWKPIIGYEGLYEVSNMGRVRSLPRRAQKSRRRPDKGYHEYSHHGHGKLLKGWEYAARKSIYYHLYDGHGNTENARLHRLVAEAHMKHIKGWSKLIVTYHDGDWRNCKLSNLRVVPRDRFDYHKGSPANRHAAKLTEDKVRQIRKLLRSNTGVTQADLARQYGVTISCISKIKTGDTWFGINP